MHANVYNTYILAQRTKQFTCVKLQYKVISASPTRLLATVCHNTMMVRRG